MYIYTYIYIYIYINYEDIYPPKLKLKKESIAGTEASFLDLSIIIKNKKLRQ